MGKLVLRDPDLSFQSLHQELNNLLKDTFGDSEFMNLAKIKAPSAWRPAVELKQNEKSYTAKVQLPGVKKEDINIDLDSEYITISAEMKQEKKSAENEKLHTNEFRYGKFMRTIAFDNPIKVNESTAEYKDGILHIKMPKQKSKAKASKKLTIK